MTNKPTYMKRIIAGSSLLFSILLATPQAYAQESVDVIIRENGTERREVIDLPKSMTYPVDSLLSDWKAKNYIDLGKDCSTSTVNPQFSDSVYIDRLSRMPTIMEMPYNEIVRKFIDMYTGRLRNQVAFMLSACNFYMPIFEEALDTYGLPLELKYLPIIESALKLLTAVLILVDGPQDGDDFLLGGQGDGAGDSGAGALGGLHDLLSGLVDQLMIVSLQADADHFFLSCHGLFPP